jgi:hypothetical protein
VTSVFEDADYAAPAESVRSGLSRLLPRCLTAPALLNSLIVAELPNILGEQRRRSPLEGYSGWSRHKGRASPVR